MKIEVIEGVFTMAVTNIDELVGEDVVAVVC